MTRYTAHMRRRPLGKTGLSVTELAVGTWGLSGDAYGPVHETEQDRVIDRAYALGVRLFETADVYAHGNMEQKLGERLPQDAELIVVTKIGTDRTTVPPRKRFDPQYLKQAFERARDRLRRDKGLIVLLHNPAAATVERGEAPAILKELKLAGAIAAWGVSAGSVEIARAAVAQEADILSMAYNAFFASDLHELHTDIAHAKTGVMARSILAHGLLSGYWAPHKDFVAGDHRSERWTPEELRRRVNQVRALRALVGGDVHTARGAALRFVLTNDDVSTIVLGPRNQIQLDQLIREAGKGPPYLPEEKLAKFAKQLDDLGVPG